MQKLFSYISKIRSSVRMKYIVGLAFVLIAGCAFAADSSGDDFAQMVAGMLNLLFTVITIFLTPAIMISGWLLSPDWTMGDFFGLRRYFRDVWILISNITYVIFALMLLYMAIMQIFSGESEYAFKKRLPRFLVGILMVPFTWFIVSQTLSISNQLVATVLSIPMGAITDGVKENQGFDMRVIPSVIDLSYQDQNPGAKVCSGFMGAPMAGSPSESTKAPTRSPQSVPGSAPAGETMTASTNVRGNGLLSSVFGNLLAIEPVVNPDLDPIVRAAQKGASAGTMPSGAPLPASIPLAASTPPVAPASAGGGSGAGSSGETFCMTPAEFISHNNSGPYFIMMIYAYAIFRINEVDIADLKDLCSAAADSAANGNTVAPGGGTSPNPVTTGKTPTPTKGCIKALGNLITKEGVALITFLFFAILTIALCWVLLARALKMWIYIMFSPLFGLAYAVGSGAGESFSGGGGGGGGHGGISMGEFGLVPFFKLAMVPVLVTAVLSFGLLFLSVMSKPLNPSAENNTGVVEGSFVCTKSLFLVTYCVSKEPAVGDKYTSYLKIGDKKQEPYTITINFGTMLSGAVTSEAATGLAKGTKDALNNIFAHVLISLVGIVILWMAVNAAVKYDGITQSAFAPFAKFGEAIGGAVQNIPSYINLPHPAFNLANPSFYEAAARKIQTETYEQAEANKARTLAEMLGSDELVKFEGLANRITDNAHRDTETLGQCIREYSGQRAGERDTSRSYNSVKKILANAGEASHLSGAELTAYNELNGLLQNAGSRKDAAQILASRTDLTSRINNPQINALFEQIQSNKPISTSAGGEAEVKLEGSESLSSLNFRLSNRGVHINKDGDDAKKFDFGSLGLPVQEKIKKIFPALDNPQNLSEDDLKKKFSRLGLKSDDQGKIEQLGLVGMRTLAQNLYNQIHPTGPHKTTP